MDDLSRNIDEEQDLDMTTIRRRSPAHAFFQVEVNKIQLNLKDKISGLPNPFYCPRLVRCESTLLN